MQHRKQPFWARPQLLARLTLNAGEDAANQPARLAQLDDGNDRAILVQGNQGPAQIVRLGHRGTPSIDVSDEIAILAARPIASLRWRELDSKFQFRDSRAATGSLALTIPAGSRRPAQRRARARGCGCNIKNFRFIRMTLRRITSIDPGCSVGLAIPVSRGTGLGGAGCGLRCCAARISSACWRMSSKAPQLCIGIEHFQGSAAGVDLIVMSEIGEALEDAEQLLVQGRDDYRDHCASPQQNDAASPSGPPG